MSRLQDRRNAKRINGLRRDPRTGAGKLAKSERGYGGVLAFDFTDQSAAIYDPTTAANISYSQGIADNGNRRGPGALLTYTSASNKICRQANGNWTYGAHNLYLNSAAPANQSITVVSGASYAVTITGTVSVTASGAATGTWTAGTNTFTAATTTLTLGSTSGSGTVHVYRTPAVTDYVATAGSAVYALPYSYAADGSCEGLLVEEARTNLCLYSNDLTQAGSWTASNMTTAKTATGPDNVANSATTITASAGNATILQAITSTSAARVTSVYIKRRTGTGNIDLTQDNGSTWTTQAVDSAWTRFSLSSVTSANPTVGIRIVTSGDAVDVALFQHEVGAFVTSPILTYGAAATRAADNISIARSATPLPAMTGASDVVSGRVAFKTPNQTSSATVLFALTDGATTNRIYSRWGGGGAGTISIEGSTTDAGGQTVSDSGAMDTNADGIIAFRALQDDYAMSYSKVGTAQDDDNTADVMGAALTTIHLGKVAASGAEFGSIIKSIVLVPSNWNNATLEAKVGK